MEDKRVQQVSLGCGTLILIALIVLIFGGGHVGDLKHDVHGLSTEVRNLKTAIDSQTEQIRVLQEKLTRLEASPAK